MIADVEKMYAWDRVGLLERSSGRAGLSLETIGGKCVKKLG